MSHAPTQVLREDFGPPSHPPPRPAGRVALIVALVAVLVLAAGATAFLLLRSTDDGFDVALEAVVAKAERPIERMDDAAREADQSRPSSLVALRAAADHAIDELDDAGTEARALNPEGGEEERQADQLQDAIGSAEELAAALAARSPSAARIEGLASQAEATAEDLEAAAFPSVRVTELVADLNRRARARRRARTAPSGSEGSASTPVSPQTTIAPPTYRQHAAYGYQAQIPTGAGWSTPADSQPTAGLLFRTSVRGPSGMFLIIDYTPAEAATFGGSYQTRREVGQTAFGSATQYVFQGGTLPECQRSRCVDYIINDRASGAGFGVLAGGPDFALASQLAQTVAESVTASPGE